MNQQTLTLFGAQPRMTSAEFDRLFLDLYPRVAGVAFRLLGDADEADEVAAEAFWKLWQNPPSGVENLPGWLYRVALNLGYNRIRSTRRRASYEERSIRMDLTGDQPVYPESMLELEEERVRIRETLKKLPARDVQVLILHFSGLSYKEIADVVRISPGSVGTILARAERKFEGLYKKGEKNAPEK